jgi:hypothetical protein
VRTKENAQAIAITKTCFPYHSLYHGNTSSWSSKFVRCLAIELTEILGGSKTSNRIAIFTCDLSKNIFQILFYLTLCNSKAKRNRLLIYLKEDHKRIALDYGIKIPSLRTLKHQGTKMKKVHK